MDVGSVYIQIKRDYFPRWDSNNEWKLRIVDDLYGAQSGCNTESKTITLVRDCSIHPGDPKIAHLKVILIHEISHATARGFHDAEWITEMEKASERAAHLGDMELARLIKEEVNRYIIRKKTTGVP